VFILKSFLWHFFWVSYVGFEEDDDSDDLLWTVVLKKMGIA